MKKDNIIIFLLICVIAGMAIAFSVKNQKSYGSLNRYTSFLGNSITQATGTVGVNYLNGIEIPSNCEKRDYVRIYNPSSQAIYIYPESSTTISHVASTTAQSLTAIVLSSSTNSYVFEIGSDIAYCGPLYLMADIGTPTIVWMRDTY